MQVIIAAVSQSTVLVKGGAKLWSGYSKSRSERERGEHAALVRRVVRTLNAPRESDLEAVDTEIQSRLMRACHICVPGLYQTWVPGKGFLNYHNGGSLYIMWFLDYGSLI